MKNRSLTAGIIDLKFNNLFSIYKACIQSGLRTSIISEKQKNFNYLFFSQINSINCLTINI